MAEYGVTPERLDEASGSVKKLVAQCDAQLQVLNASITNLLGPAWTGRAADALSGDFMLWLDGAAQVRNALDGISDLLAGSAQVYRETDANVQKVSDEMRVEQFPGLEATRQERLVSTEQLARRED